MTPTLWTETNLLAAAHTCRFSSSVCEIEEIEEEEEINHGMGMASIKEVDQSSLFPFDVNDAEESVYVAVGKSESSMDALSWTLSHFVNTSTILYLIHVFSEIRHIPSPCKQSKALQEYIHMFSSFSLPPSILHA